MSIYIHIPFCNNICFYCDFCKFYYNKKWVGDYLNALMNEIKLNYKGEEISTIYIGGGTPSCLSLEELGSLFSILKMFKLSKNIEFTIECNIDDITIDKIKLFKKFGINRLSIGIQTFNSSLLKKLNRTCDYYDVKNKINLIKNLGISNINVDLIYAIPGQSIENLNDDIDKLLDLEIEHISTYSLIIEPHTVLYNNKLTNIDEDLDYEMYKTICERLKDNGYNHYEISNFSIPGYHSKHNLTYWNNDHYYGFGLSASGYIDNLRYTNTRNLTEYLKGNYLYEEEHLEEKDAIEYELILGLRKLDGISKIKFYDKYKKNIEDIYDINDLVNKKLLTNDGENIKISEDKIYISNEILVNFIRE